MQKLKVNVGKSKFMRCSRHGNGRSNACETPFPLEEVDCFKYVGCVRDVAHRINGHRAWGELKSVLSNR